MSALSDGVMRLSEAVAPGAPVVHFDYAVYHNVGDLLLSKATERFFALNRNRVIDSYSILNYRSALARTFPEDAVFVFQGGGNIGDIHPAHQQMREEVMRAHVKRRAVIFPQSVYFDDAARLTEAAEMFARCENLTIVARDDLSFAIFSKYFRNRVLRAPDTAHILYGAMPPAPAPKQETLHFIRQDHAGFDDGLAMALGDIPKSALLDWPGFLSPADWRIMRLGYYAHRADEKTVHTPLPAALWRVYRDRLIARAAALFADHALIVTNRLHGLILGMLVGRPVQFFDTGRGKIVGYYDTWLKGAPGVTALPTPAAEETLMAGLARPD
ncbi:MAG: polysaccharide pyruvyl transferase family protein [Parvularculaceae bacterium]